MYRTVTLFAQHGDMIQLTVSTSILDHHSTFGFYFGSLLSSVNRFSDDAGLGESVVDHGPRSTVYSVVAR